MKGPRKSHHPDPLLWIRRLVTHIDTHSNHSTALTSTHILTDSYEISDNMHVVAATIIINSNHFQWNASLFRCQSDGMQVRMMYVFVKRERK